MDLTRNFARAEFACKCGCGFNDVDIELAFRLQAFRDQLGEPIQVLSGCRCPQHNRLVGGARNSQHLHGKAADISVHGLSAPTLATLCSTSGLFKGIGSYPGFVHVDVRLRPARWRG